jgi:hypothetical protein
MFHKRKVKEGEGEQILGELRVTVGMTKSRHALLVGSSIVNLRLQLSRWEGLGEGLLQTTGGDPGHHRILVIIICGVMHLPDFFVAGPRWGGMSALQYKNQHVIWLECCQPRIKQFAPYST